MTLPSIVQDTKGGTWLFSDNEGVFITPEIKKKFWNTLCISQDNVEFTVALDYIHMKNYEHGLLITDLSEYIFVPRDELHIFKDAVKRLV